MPCPLHHVVNIVMQAAVSPAKTGNGNRGPFPEFLALWADPETLKKAIPFSANVLVGRSWLNVRAALPAFVPLPGVPYLGNSAKLGRVIITPTVTHIVPPLKSP